MKKFVSVLVVLVSMLSLGGQVFAQDEPELTETFTSETGDLTFMYPEDWEIISEFGLTYVVKGGEEVIEADEMPSGGAAVAFLTPELMELMELEGASPLEVIESLRATILQENDDLEATEVEETTLDNEAENEMALVMVTDVTGDGFVAAIGYEVGTLAVIGLAPTGEFEDVEPTIRAILNTVVLQAPDPVAVEEMTPPEDNAVTWETDTVTLTANNFYIEAGSTIFTADVDDIDIDGDPGSDEYTTLEVTWMEHDVEMRVNIYFEADGEEWRAFELRIYDGNDPGEWVTFEGEQFSAALGDSYSIGAFGRGQGPNSINFNGLSVQAFTSAE